VQISDPDVQREEFVKMMGFEVEETTGLSESHHAGTMMAISSLDIDG